MFDLKAFLILPASLKPIKLYLFLSFNITIVILPFFMCTTSFKFLSIIISSNPNVLDIIFKSSVLTLLYKYSEVYFSVCKA